MACGRERMICETSSSTVKRRNNRFQVTYIVTSPFDSTSSVTGRRSDWRKWIFSRTLRNEPAEIFTSASSARSEQGNQLLSNVSWRRSCCRTLRTKRIVCSATDELPQSAAGKTIMTTEPKFVPNQAVKISRRRRIGSKRPGRRLRRLCRERCERL